MIFCQLSYIFVLGPQGPCYGTLDQNRPDQTRPDHLNRVSSSLSRSCSISIFSKYFSAEQTYCIGGQMCINRSRQLLGSGIFNSRKLVVFEFAEMCLYLINFCTFCIYSVCSSVWLIRRSNQDQVILTEENFFFRIFDGTDLI